MIAAMMIPHSRPWITETDQLSVQSVLASGMIAQGEKVLQFENAVCNYLGVRYAVTQSSGTAALVLALRTLDIGHNDEVILPTYVCRSVLEAVLSVGARPVLCDVDDTGVVTTVTIDPHITSKTKAIIAVHIFGHPCNLEGLKQMGIPVIGDACQAFGLNINGLMSEAFGDIGILSFHATKCLTSGEGGMLVTCNKAWGERARQLAEGSTSPSLRNVAPVSDLQAALGLSQLGRYSDFLNRCNELRCQYTKEAQRLGIKIGDPAKSNMLFRFTLRTDQLFEIVQAKFREQGVSVRRGVDELLHRTLGLSDSLFPIAVRLYEQTISVPFYPSLSIDESTVVSNAFRIIKYVD